MKSPNVTTNSYNNGDNMVTTFKDAALLEIGRAIKRPKFGAILDNFSV